MPVDLTILRHTIDVLKAFDGNPMPERTIAVDVELRTGLPLTTQDVTDALNVAHEKGWAAYTQDQFYRRLWYVTPAGKVARF